VQAAYNNEIIAFRFAWKSHAKTFPEGSGNNGLVYPGQFHDFMQHNGTAFAQVAEEERFNEDRVSFMIEEPARPAQGFAAAGCYISCHSGMVNHKLGTSGFLDHWHWRGGRSGPMGYAEDAWVSDVQRERDTIGAPPSSWLRSAGDRLREDQPAFAADLTGHSVLTDRLPRFVFNKGKQMPGGFEIPSHFLAMENGAVVTAPYTQLPQVKDVFNNRSLLVVYQDRNFDKSDKVNAVDLGYLVYVANNGQLNQLPTHLRDTSSAAFATWAGFWSAELGIAADPNNFSAASAARNRLDAVHAEWEQSGRKSLVTRSVGFIYPSDQHDIAATRAFDPIRGIWSVTMYRKLSTGRPNDTDLALLKSGTLYNLGVAVHDVGDGHESHHISFMHTLGKADTGTDIKASLVSDVSSVNWNDVPAFVTSLYQPGTKTGTFLRSTAHPGAGVFETMKCQTCHTDVKAMPGLVAR
jgi:hypothetical protein